MRYNLHPLRNLPVGTDPGVLTSNGMSVTGGAVVSLAERKNEAANPHFADPSTSHYSTVGQGTVTVISDDGDGDSFCREVSRDGGINMRLRTVDASAVPVTPGQSVALLGSIKPVSTTGTWEYLYLRVGWRDSGGAQVGGEVVNVASVIGHANIAPLVGEWVRLSGVAVAPAGAAKCLLEVTAGTSDGSSRTVRFDRLHIEPRRLAISPEDFLPDNDPRPVPGWNPLTGQFDASLQAVRVYIPAGASSTTGHRFVLPVTPGDPISALTHVHTDDPGSVGRLMRLYTDFRRGDNSVITGSWVDLSLSAAPTPLPHSTTVPSEAATAGVWIVRPNSLETNLLYSASQVSPHPIPAYRDERSQGWRLRDEGSPHLGAESIPAPIHRNAVCSIQPYSSTLSIAPYRSSLSLAGEEVTV